RTAGVVQARGAHGCAGPGCVQGGGLPPGVGAGPPTTPPEMVQGLVVLTAGPTAKVDAAIVRVVGKAKIDGQTVERASAVSEEIYLPGGGRGRFEAQMHAVAVTEASDILKVNVSPIAITLKPGQE